MYYKRPISYDNNITDIVLYRFFNILLYVSIKIAFIDVIGLNYAFQY